MPCNHQFADCKIMNVDVSIMDTATEEDTPAAATYRRPCSQSYHSPEEPEDSGIRQRSRSFYSYDSSEGPTEGNFTRSNAMRPRSSSVLQGEAAKKQKSGNGIVARLLTKRSKGDHNKNMASSDLNGRGGKIVPLITISKSENWEINSSSSMKCGQFVDWEKIDPESAMRYQKLLQSDHQELKAMARNGFWSKPLTLRAKAYNHIIHSIRCRSVIPDRDVYPKLTWQLFGEQKISTHLFPEYIQDGIIPAYCLNKAGLNSAKKILLCIGKHFPDINFCPILPALVSLLLHFSEDEAECFHCVCRLIAYNDPNKRYIDQTFLTCRASCMTFGDLANKYCCSIRELIAASNQNLYEFYSDWIMWIFTGLPFTYAIRVLDVYLLEGYKVLYRVSLALLSLYSVSVASRVADVDDFRQDMKCFVENITHYTSIEILLETAFSFQLATQRELNFFFNVNKEALVKRGFSIHQKRLSDIAVDLENFRSSVVTERQMRMVWAWIPERYSLLQPVMLFNTDDHGRSLSSLYSRVEGHEPTVLLLKTVDKQVCGALLSSDWKDQKKHDGGALTFFGSGECLIFTLHPGMEWHQQTVVHLLPTYLTVPFAVPSEGPLLASLKRAEEQYPPSGLMIMAGDKNRRVVEGGRGHLLRIAADLMSGQTGHCNKFDSSPPCEEPFRIQSLEVWGIQNSITSLSQ